MTIKLYLIFALALTIGYVFGRYHARYRTSNFQNSGEALVSRAIESNFNTPDYHLLNHITLTLEDGTTQIDHILVSRFGVFVIETKNFSGWIFANAKQATWTQVLFHKKFKFQNPIFQNMRHVNAVKNTLDFLQPNHIKSLVVFTGDAKFKTDVPTEVFTVSKLVKYLRSHNDEVMSLNRMQFCVGRLETARLAISGETDLAHVKSLQSRHGAKN
mgnify:FL=1|jgi:hypothetical protein